MNSKDYAKKVVEIMTKNQEEWNEYSKEDGLPVDPVFFESFWDNLQSKDIFSIQPMIAPASLVYFMKFDGIDGDDPENGFGGTIQMKVDSTTVAAKRAQLKTRWSPEAVHDLAAVHGIDATKEMSYILGMEVAQEVDVMLTRWVLGSVSNVVEADWRTLDFVSFLRNAGQRMYDRSKRRMVNWIVASPSLIKLLTTKFNDFVVDPERQKMRGLQRMGQISPFGRIDIYCCDGLPDFEMLMGAAGESFLDRGAVFAPYNFSSGPVEVDAETFAPRKPINMRYGNVIACEQTLEVVRFSNLPKEVYEGEHGELVKALTDLIEKDQMKADKRTASYFNGKIDGLRAAIDVILEAKRTAEAKR